MTRKLTLQMDEELIRFGKRWAQSRGTSLSALIANFLAVLRKLPEGGELPPVTRQLLGVARRVDESDSLRHLEEKELGGARGVAARRSVRER